MAPIYATVEDLATWASVYPANADQLLRRASALVRKATATAFYATGPDGLPTDPDTLAAFRDATTAQVTLWNAAGIDPTTGGLTVSSPLKGKKIGSAAIDYDTTATSSLFAYNARATSTSTLCTESLEILQAAGINMLNPWVAG